MAAMNQDSATEDEAGGITRRIKDYCDQAVASIKAGRIKEAYVFANEALELDGKDAKVAALHRHVLYAIHPKKKLLDKTKALHEEADQCTKAGQHDKALEMLSLAKKWHCTPGILYLRSFLNMVRSRFDLAYVDITEGLAECKGEKVPVIFARTQRMSLFYLGYKVLPVTEPDVVPQLDEMPARYHVNNWPTGLRINHLFVYLEHYAEAMKADCTMLEPHVPLDQLAQFLNNHVQGAIGSLTLFSNDRSQDRVPRLLDEVTVPGRLHFDFINFTDFFRLPWASIERILDGRTLRAMMVDFLRLQLPSGVEANELLKLPMVRECAHLHIALYDRIMPQLPGLPPLFNNAALLEWIKRSGGRSLRITRDYLSSGLLSFLDALKKATQVHAYGVTIHCPCVDVVAGLGVRNEEFSNRLGEKMRIGVGQDREATYIMGHQFVTVFVKRLPPR